MSDQRPGEPFIVEAATQTSVAGRIRNYFLTAWWSRVRCW